MRFLCDSARSTIYVIALAAAGLGLRPSWAQGFDAWSKHRNVVINTSASGANVAGNVQGFPLPVLLNATNFNFAEAKDDGSDLRFSKADGTPLPYQVEHWDKAAQKGAAWVKTDVLGNNASQYIVMHWGNPSAPAAGEAARVFDKADGWVGVWHLSETGSGATGHYKDATANAGHGTGQAITGGASGDGRVGRAVNLDVGNRQYIRIENSTTNPIYDLRTTATYSIWANPKSHTISYQAIFTKGETGFRIHFYGLPTWPDNTDPNTKVNKNITEPCIEMQGGGDFCPVEGVERPGQSQSTAWKGEDIKNGTWHHLLLVLNQNKDVAWYVDGRHRITWRASGTIVSGTEIVAIGNNATRARQFDGLLDEARILNVAKDADWVKLDFESQKEGSQLLQHGGATSVFKPLRHPSRLAPGASDLRGYDVQGRRQDKAERRSLRLFEWLSGVVGANDVGR